MRATVFLSIVMLIVSWIYMPALVKTLFTGPRPSLYPRRHAKTTSEAYARFKLSEGVRIISQYETTARGLIDEKGIRYQRLPSKHKRETFHVFQRYRDALAIVEDNIKMMNDMAAFGRAYYNITDKEANLADPSRSGVDVFNHMVRDWSEINAQSRERLFKPIWKWLGKSDKRSLLVPGAGVGRFCSDASKRGFQVDAVEFSPEMHIASLFASNVSESYNIYPWLLEYSHLRKSADQVAATSIDLKPARVTHYFDNFLTFSPNKTYDAIVTLFFMDSAVNMLEYIDRIEKHIASDGVWINLGPMNYGADSMISFSVDEVLEVLKQRGWVLDVLDGETNRYEGSESSMRAANYKLYGWRAHKRSSLTGKEK